MLKLKHGHTMMRLPRLECRHRRHHRRRRHDSSGGNNLLLLLLHAVLLLGPETSYPLYNLLPPGAAAEQQQ